MADCLEAWQQCLSLNDQSLSQKDFDKFWVTVYQRFDSGSNQEKKQAGRKCNFEGSLKKSIYDFERPELVELKQFLKQLSAAKDSF